MAPGTKMGPGERHLLARWGGLQEEVSPSLSPETMLLVDHKETQTLPSQLCSAASLMDKPETQNSRVSENIKRRGSPTYGRGERMF